MTDDEYVPWYAAPLLYFVLLCDWAMEKGEEMLRRLRRNPSR